MDGAEPVAALAAARKLVESAVDEVVAAQRVGWESEAALRFREEAAVVTRRLVGELDTLDGAARLAGGLS
ncbi:hypothetical protein [Myceligenerans pegani]|uniref:Uncharacterized protein n=1 Tax=Myceligenerans pegani TaxID=2776917 RepID=A0ABR9MSZ2_9MICO|nr:hypothetical protein [Myceligenerans sp. TRM 65318]MBE1874146.1 hypothetical protein [Myceligenerans sp. TRM 65318]MBE3016418.1 hypothetical protein [Myceligenerans sp. TRM 65318]